MRIVCEKSPLGTFSRPCADRQLSAARTAFKSWIEQIDRDSVAILQEASATGSRARILGAGRLARQRHKAGEQVEELDFRIRTQFPHPLAYMWRAVQIKHPNPFEQLRNLVKAAEGHTAFLAMTGILMSKACGLHLSQLNTMREQLSGKQGTTFGQWTSILKEIHEKKELRTVEGTTPFYEIIQLRKDDAWKRAVTYLSSLRNDEGHHRLSEQEIRNGVLKKLEESLGVIYRATDFLTDYHLIQVIDTRFDSFRGTTHFRYRDLTGDNPLTSEREDSAARADLEKDSAYLKDRQGHFHLFRPLLNYLRCPQCHEMATFYLDAFTEMDNEIKVRLKSIERSSVRHEQLTDEFAQIGLFRAKCR